MKLINKTEWDTRALRSILLRVAKEEFERSPERIKRLHVTVQYARRNGYWVTGRAYVGGSTSRLMVPRPGRCKRAEIKDNKAVRDANGAPIWREDFPALDFAITAAHEFGHNRGLQHRQMAFHHRCHSRYAHEHFAWADKLVVLPKAPRARPTLDEKRAKELAKAQAAVKRCERRAKLAQTLLKKWTRRVRELERRIAASPPPNRLDILPPPAV